MGWGGKVMLERIIFPNRLLDRFVTEIGTSHYNLHKRNMARAT